MNSLDPRYIYQNPSINGTYPNINDKIQTHPFDLIIYFNQSVSLSNGNLTVYQYLNDNDIILRQIAPAGQSELCKLINNNTAISVKLFASTLHQANVKYGVKVDNNFAISYPLNEPLLGISERIWTFNTCKMFISMMFICIS